MINSSVAVELAVVSAVRSLKHIDTALDAVRPVPATTKTVVVELAVEESPTPTPSHVAIDPSPSACRPDAVD